MNIIHTDNPEHKPINLDLVMYIYGYDTSYKTITFYLLKNTISWYFNSNSERDICFEKVLSYSTNISKIVKL